MPTMSVRTVSCSDCKRSCRKVSGDVLSAWDPRCTRCAVRSLLKLVFGPR